jgi:hypothetical protein
MATARVSQADTSTVFVSDSGTDISQADVSTVFNVPSDEVQISQVDDSVVSGLLSAVHTSQLDTVVVFLGRASDPKVRAWTFTLDGHDFYVLRLGDEETLVYDTLIGEWYVWASGLEFNTWRANTGINWRGGGRWATVFGSDVVTGDDSTGTIYLLNPEAETDDDPAEGALLQRPFERQVTAQTVITGGYDFMSCFGVQMFGSVGQNTLAGTVELETSDDRGRTYQLAGVLSIQPQDLDLRLEWDSLGSMRAPGRLFRFTDHGVVHRIDNLIIDMEREDGQ